MTHNVETISYRMNITVGIQYSVVLTVKMYINSISQQAQTISTCSYVRDIHCVRDEGHHVEFGNGKRYRFC